MVTEADILRIMKRVKHTYNLMRPLTLVMHRSTLDAAAEALEGLRKQGYVFNVYTSDLVEEGSVVLLNGELLDMTPLQFDYKYMEDPDDKC